MNQPRSNLALRVTTALVILPVVLALIWAPALRLGLSALVVLVILVVMHEFYGLFHAKQISTQDALGLIGGLGIGVSAHFGELAYVNAALVAAAAAAGLGHVLTPPPSAAGLAGTLAGLVYAAWCPAHVLLLASLDSGRGLIMLLVVAVVFTDTAAYFVGRALGRHALAPIVSPKKTWEGAIGGFIFAIIGAAAVSWLRDEFDWMAFPDWTVARYAVTGAAVSAVAQLSDLMKSSIKRDAGVKDSGRLLPGHGGALDRFDGFLLGAPVLYYMSVF